MSIFSVVGKVLGTVGKVQSFIPNLALDALHLPHFTSPVEMAGDLLQKGKKFQFGREYGDNAKLGALAAAAYFGGPALAKAAGGSGGGGGGTMANLGNILGMLNQGGGQQPPSFQLPKFGSPSDAARSPIYSAFMPTLTADTGRGPGFQLPPLTPPQAPTPTLNTPSIAEDAQKNPDKLSTKDYITQAFLGNLIQSAFGPKQASPYTFSPPVFR